jgi:hypothetical protein
MEGDIQRVKELMTSYNKAHQASQQMESIKKQLVPLLKRTGMVKTKFDFGDHSIGFHSYKSPESINKALIERVIKEKYPQINSKQFIYDLYTARNSKTLETIRVLKA